MGLSIDISQQISAANRVVEAMKTRTRSWAKKAKPEDRAKINERAAEIMTIETALNTASKDYTPIILEETGADAYRRGFEAAKRQQGPSQHGIIDRRQVVFDNLGFAYNAENERKRKAHNARQKEKWAHLF